VTSHVCVEIRIARPYVRPAKRNAMLHTHYCLQYALYNDFFARTVDIFLYKIITQSELPVLLPYEERHEFFLSPAPQAFLCHPTNYDVPRQEPEIAFHTSSHYPQ